MGSLPGKLSPFAAILSVAALAIFASPASSQSLMASSNYSGKATVISDLRIGTHPGKTRIVLDVSQPTDLSYRVSNGGKTLSLDMPNATWQASDAQNRHIGGNIVSFSHSAASKGSRLTLQSNTAIRIKRPFFVSPGGNRGHRIVIDLVPGPSRAPASMIASLDNIGALPGQNSPRGSVEVAQISGSPNPYIQRAFPQRNQMRNQKQNQIRRQPTAPKMAPQQPTPRQAAPQQPPYQATPYQQQNKFLGLPNTYARGTLGLHIINETSNEGGNNNYDAEFSPGFLLSGALGTRLDNGFRVEGEMFYSNATLKQISGTAVGTVYNTENVNGDMSAIAFMANLAYDFPNNSRLTPYVMGGVGMAGLFLNEFKASNTSITDDMDWVFALQVGTGVSFALDNRTSIELGYRYFETEEPEFAAANGTPFKSVFSSHNFLIGARVDLN